WDRLGRGAGAAVGPGETVSRGRCGTRGEPVRRRDAGASGRHGDVPPRLRRRRHRFRDHARRARERPPDERGAAPAAARGARERAAGVRAPRADPRRGREEAVEARGGGDRGVAAGGGDPGRSRTAIPRGARDPAARCPPRPVAHPAAGGRGDPGAVGRGARGPRRRRCAVRAGDARRARPERGPGVRPAGRDPRAGGGRRHGDPDAVRRARRPAAARSAPRVEGCRRRSTRLAACAHRSDHRARARRGPGRAAAGRGAAARAGCDRRPLIGAGVGHVGARPLERGVNRHEVGADASPRRGYRRPRGWRDGSPPGWGHAAKMGSMRLYNTLTRRVEELPPPPGPIRMYFCGPTVYQRIHVGNARPFVLSIWLRGWLRERGYEVRLVENVTDVNDKIYEAAPGASAKLAARATQWYREDTDLLGLGRPDVEPLATEAVPAIVAAIEELVRRGLAYEVDGDVYFRVARDARYGQLSRQRPDQVEEQEPNPRKEEARDFALWKANKPGEDTSWESPWGRGRPGWHIECSVMAEQHLGPVFEIHGGGLDLVFPHHENELAQSRALGHEFARVWMHNGMLEFTGEKMAKSVGNVVTIRDAIEAWGRETVLLLFLGSHWRKPMEFSEETLRQAEAQAETFRNFFLDVDSSGGLRDERGLAAVLDDDFNTADALALFHEWRSR